MFGSDLLPELKDLFDNPEDHDLRAWFGLLSVILALAWAAYWITGFDSGILPDPSQIAGTWTRLTFGVGGAIILLLISWISYLHIRLSKATQESSGPSPNATMSSSNTDPEAPVYKNVQDDTRASRPYTRDRYVRTIEIANDGSGTITSDIYNFTRDTRKSGVETDIKWRPEYEDAILTDLDIKGLNGHPDPKVDIKQMNDQEIIADVTIPVPIGPNENYSYRTQIYFGKLYPMTKQEAEGLYKNHDWSGPDTAAGMRHETDFMTTRIIFPGDWKDKWDKIKCDPVVFPSWISELMHSVINDETTRKGFVEWDKDKDWADILAEKHPDQVKEELRDLKDYMDKNDMKDGRPWALLTIKKPWFGYMFGIGWIPPKDPSQG